MDNSESRFTPARDWCPHPEYWHSPDSEATENEVSEFIGSLVRLIQPEFVVETGTYQGHTTAHIAMALYDNGHGRVVSVDSDMKPLGYAFERISRLNDSFETDLPVQILHMNSSDYVPDQNIDLAFFDSWQEGRHEEFLRFHQMGRLKQGAIVAFHDTAPHHAVRKFIIAEDGSLSLLKSLLNIIDFHTPRGLIVGQVK